MTIQEIPIDPTLSDFEQETELDGRQFLLRMVFNARNEGWYLSLFDANEDAIRTGIRMVLRWPLLEGVVDPRRPPGDLMLIDLENSDVDPGLGELGERVQLVYLEAEDVS